ncbi:amino acid ABC transporter permease [Basilea psittacipulmonis]|uniref:Amino acid ABC transporter permease n=1 Tax=Basilea psittacipulmonis DSM 24701 TaxID=1072685 RepID=A0A077DJK9_9BURK|nr:amino acid ABC transporter permease [Basilea psittacipulmonis]AIL33233.1 amino acid ABC transporter permease [Basilea psittacipulmonis DSM 24701]
MSGKNFSWQNPKVRAWVYQIIVLIAVALGVWYLVDNTLHNLSSRRIATGFGFLDQEAGFAIGESVIDFQPSDTYRKAIVVGLLNTIKVSVLGIVLSTIFGVLLGLARLSKNFLLAKLASIYVEVVRNIPLIIQLFFWYVIIIETLPSIRQAWSISNAIFLSNRGLYLPSLSGGSLIPVCVALVIAVLACWVVAGISKKHQNKTGKLLPTVWINLVILCALPVLTYYFSGTDLHWELPHRERFNFVGGWVVTPELTALLLGLVVYTTGLIAEIVRSGISSIDKGQWEAAQSIGLKTRWVLRLVILPLSLRVIIPPLTSTYLNFVKNSSLAIAVGYPDIVAVVNTIMNQTGQAIETVMIIMATYLTVSLAISLLMNWYNKRIELVER